MSDDSPDTAQTTPDRSPTTPVDLLGRNVLDLDTLARLWLLVERGRSVVVAGEASTVPTVRALASFLPPGVDAAPLAFGRTDRAVDAADLPAAGSPVASAADLRTALTRDHPDCLVGPVGRYDDHDAGRDRLLAAAVDAGCSVLAAGDDLLGEWTAERLTGERAPAVAITQRPIGEGRVRTERVSERPPDAGADAASAGVDAGYRPVVGWQRSTDAYVRGRSPQAAAIHRDASDGDDRAVEDDLFRRQVVLAGLIDAGIDRPDRVRAVLRGYAADPAAVLGHVLRDDLATAAATLRDGIDDGERAVDRRSGEGDGSTDEPAVRPALREELDHLLSRGRDHLGEFEDAPPVGSGLDGGDSSHDTPPDWRPSPAAIDRAVERASDADAGPDAG